MPPKFGILFYYVLLSSLKANGTTKIRNGKVYIGCWVDKEIENKSQKKAKEQKRTLSAYIELALAYRNQDT